MSRIFIFLLLVIVGCECRQDGAPKSACSSLTPVHSGLEAQRSASPYSVSAVKHGNKIRVTIVSNVGEEIEGFVLQARSSKDKHRMVEGKFSEKSGVAKAIDCFGGQQNTLTHVNPSPKRQISTEWMPSEGNVHEDIFFRATVAKTFALFWTEVDSKPLRIMSDGGANNARAQKKEDLNSESMYYNCFVSKGCFGYPSGCIPRTDCEVLLSYVNGDDGVTFTMSGFLEPNTYMATGLSRDNQMGDDAITECFRQGSTVVMRESWNERRSNTRTQEMPRNRYDGKFNDGLTTCSWIERYIKVANGIRFNLANSTYYVLLAKGPVENERIGYHSGKLSTQEAVNFTAFEAIVGEGVSDSIKIHGTFMATAWLGFVSVAILLARHFKSAWENRTFCGVKIWFALHRSMMFCALVFAITAFIVIFVHKGGWNYETRNPHAILGCIAFALGLFQPIMAAFRPAPDDKKRPIFNWMHFIVGNSAWIIAVITMFFAVSLESSGLNASFYWVMAIFVVVHLLFHFLFQMQTWTSGKKKNEVKMVEMNARASNNMQNAVPDKNLDNVFRILLLGIYCIFLVVIILALYALIGVA